MQLRPSFRYQCTGGAESVATRIADALKLPGAPCRGRVRDGRLELVVNVEDPHFWAPEMRARIFEEGPQTIVQGHFAPKPETWTMFLAIYAATLFSTGIGGVFGLAQWQLGSSPWALWTVPAGLAAIGMVWLGARLGQRLGADNMQTLQTFVEQVLSAESAANT